MTNKKIPPLDLMFFLTESAQSPKHVGAVQVFELPADAPQDYLLKLVAEFKKAPVVTPFNQHPVFPRLGRPEWQVDEDIEIDYHVRHSAVPRPGNNQQLMEVVQRLHAGLLDRRRPGWICQVIEGLEHNRFAIYTKIHHAYIDGMSGVKRMYGSLSSSRADDKIVPTWSFDPGQATSSGARKRAGISLAKRSRALASQAWGMVEAAEMLAKISLQVMRLRDSEGQVPFMASRNRMNRPIEWDTRSTAVCTLPLDRIRAIGKSRDCTVNEVVLAIIGAALDDYLEAHHEASRDPLVALCPMSIRAEGDDSASTQVSAVHVRLGDPKAGIALRLQQVIDSSHAAKQEVRGVSAEAMIDYGVLIFGLWELIERTGLGRFVTPSYNVLVSNVPGPGDEDLYLNGSRMVASFPISTLLPGVNLNATLLSHGNSLDFGLLGDRHALPDLERVVERMAFHFAALEAAALGSRPAGAAIKAATKTTAKKRSRASSKTPRKARSGAETGAQAKRGAADTAVARAKTRGNTA